MSPARSRYLQTRALVVGSMRYREADRILTLYTRERGRLSALVKGVRRTKSRVGGRVEPFSLIEAQLYRGTAGSLYTLTGVETTRTFMGARDTLFRMQAGARLLDVVKRAFPEEERHIEAFFLLVRSIAALSEAGDAEAAERVVASARAKLMLALGYLPQLNTCVRCGSRENLHAFHPGMGGVVCSACCPGETHEYFLFSSSGFAALRSVLEHPVDEVGVMELSAEATREVGRVIGRLLEFHGH